MNEPKPIGVGVVGIGFGQQVHVPAFNADERCRVVAIAASTLDRAKPIAAKLNIPAAYGDWRALIADPAVRIVSIAVPPARQPEIAIAAARAGKPVFCEKPSAVTVDDARAMLDAAEAAKVPHAIDLLFPEVPAWQQAKSILADGRLGPLRHAALTWRVETYAVRHNMDNWKTDPASGGGTLLNFVSHSLHYLEWMLGPIEAVTARVHDVRVDGWLELASGVPVNLSVACDSFLGPGHRLEIYGRDGTLVLDNPTKDHISGFSVLLAGRSDDQLKPLTSPVQTADKDGRVAAMGSIVRRFVDAVTGGGRVTPGLAEGLRVQRLIQAMRTSDKTGTRCGVDKA